MAPDASDPTPKSGQRTRTESVSGDRQRWWREVRRSMSEVEADELQVRALGLGADPVAGCAMGERARVVGVLRAVTLRPAVGVPAVVAELYDGTGTVNIVWLGRRRIAGIDPGRFLTAEGRINERSGSRVMFNPRYALLRGPDD